MPAIRAVPLAGKVDAGQGTGADPCGWSAANTLRSRPSLPEASRPCTTINMARFRSAYSIPCSVDARASNARVAADNSSAPGTQPGAAASRSRSVGLVAGRSLFRVSAMMQRAKGIPYAEAGGELHHRDE